MVLVLITVLVVIRGVFYPFVDGGPYDTSWGGPTRGGAWAAHLAVAVPSAVVAVLALAGIGRLGRAVENGPTRAARLVVLGLGVLGAAVLILWLVTQVAPALG